MRTKPFFLGLLLIFCFGIKPVCNAQNGTFEDSRDQHVYKYVKIGTQTWMAENLAYLPAVSPGGVSETTHDYFVNGYEGSNVASAKAAVNYSTYGVLYSWVAAQNACPSDWHLPSDAEWTILTEYLGVSAGSLMKEAGSTHWSSPNPGATNASGFTALPGGYRHQEGYFFYLGSYAYFWSSSDGGPSEAWYRSLHCYYAGVYRNYDDRSIAFSVRCLQNK